MASTILNRRAAGRMSTSYFYKSPYAPAASSGGGGGDDEKKKRRYFSEAHRDKVQARGNLERAIAIPLEEGNWEMAFDLMTKKYRLPGLKASHISDTFAVAARQLHLLSDPKSYNGNSSSSGEGRSSQAANSNFLEPSSLTSAHRRLAAKILTVKGECVEGRLPQSAGLWTQLVFLQSQMGLVEEALDSAETAMRCLSSAPSASSAPTNQNNSALSSGDRASQRLAWGSKVSGSGGVSSSSSATHSFSAPTSSSSSLAPTKGLSAATRRAMGEMLLPVAARQGKTALAEQIAKELMGIDVARLDDLRRRRREGEGSSSLSQSQQQQRIGEGGLSPRLFANNNNSKNGNRYRSGDVQQQSPAEAMVRRWLAEAYARTGNTARALQFFSSDAAAAPKNTSTSTSTSTSSSGEEDAAALQRRRVAQLPDALASPAAATPSSSFLASDVFFKELDRLDGALPPKMNVPSHQTQTQTEGADVAVAPTVAHHRRPDGSCIVSVSEGNTVTAATNGSSDVASSTSFAAGAAAALRTAQREAAYNRVLAALRGLSRPAASSMLLASATACEGAFSAIARLSHSVVGGGGGVSASAGASAEAAGDLLSTHNDSLLSAVAIVDVLYPNLFECLAGATVASSASGGSSETSPDGSFLAPLLPPTNQRLAAMLDEHVFSFRTPARLNELRAILNILGVFQQAQHAANGDAIGKNSNGLSADASSPFSGSHFLLRGANAEGGSSAAAPWAMAVTLLARVMGFASLPPMPSSLASSSSSVVSGSARRGGLGYFESRQQQVLFYDQRCVDIVFAMLPVPPPRETFVRWGAELQQRQWEQQVAHRRQQEHILRLRQQEEALAGSNAASGLLLPPLPPSPPSPPSQPSSPCEASLFAIRLLDLILANCDAFAVTLPVAKAAASALLNTDNSSALTSDSDAASNSGEGPPANWRRALLLIRNSPVNSREKKAQRATPLELDVARVVSLLQRYGPTAACRRDAVAMFPHLFPKNVVLDTLGGGGGGGSGSVSAAGEDRSDDDIDAEVKFYLQQQQHQSGEGSTADASEPASTAGGDSGAFEEDDDLLLMQAQSSIPNASSSLSKQHIDAADDGSRPCDAEYNFLRGYRNTAAFHANSGSSSALSQPLSLSTAVLADKPIVSVEASRRGLEHYFKNKIARTNEALRSGGAYERALSKISGDSLRLSEHGLGAEGTLGPDGATPRNALGISGPASTLSEEALEKYFPADKDPFAHPRSAPIGIDSEASGWSQLNRGRGSVARYSVSPRSAANPMWPKHMPRLNNPLRSWRESGAQSHSEAVRKWSGNKAM